jgi:NDP-sugar pyrophosphorylase family protein
VSPAASLPPVRTALVLAAGKSTRIRSAVSGRPKPLIQVGGRAVLEWNLGLLAAAGVRDVWINLHYQGEQIQAAIGDGSRYDLRVRYSWEATLLGTAGAAKQLERELGQDTFVVVYGDNVTALDLRAMVAQHRQRGALVTIAVFDRERVPNTGLAGGRVVLTADHAVQRFEESSTLASPYVNAGVYVLEPSVLQRLPAQVVCDFGRDVFPALLEAGARIDAYLLDGFCLAIDTPEALARAEALVRDLQATGALAR